MNINLLTRMNQGKNCMAGTPIPAVLGGLYHCRSLARWYGVPSRPTIIKNFPARNGQHIFGKKLKTVFIYFLALLAVILWNNNNYRLSLATNPTKTYSYAGNLIINSDIPEAQSEFEEGMKMAEKNKFADAIKHFKKAIKLDSKFARPYCAIGTVYRKKAEIKIAKKEITEETYNEKLVETISYYKKAIELNPRYPIALDNLGFTYILLHKYEDAISYLKKASTIDPTYPDAHFNLGFLYSQMGNNKKAISEYKIFIKMTNHAKMKKTAQKMIEKLAKKQKH